MINTPWNGGWNRVDRAPRHHFGHESWVLACDMRIPNVPPHPTRNTDPVICTQTRTHTHTHTHTYTSTLSNHNRHTHASWVKDDPFSTQECCEILSTNPKTIICSSSLHGPLTRYVKLRVAHAPGMPGTFSPPPTSKEAASQRSRHASRHVRDARAEMHVGIANPRWRGKRSRHSRRMRNPQFYVSGRRSNASIAYNTFQMFVPHYPRFLRDSVSEIKTWTLINAVIINAIWLHCHEVMHNELTILQCFMCI